MDLALVRSLHVTNLPEGCTEAQLRSVFDALGPATERIALLDNKNRGPHGGDGGGREYAFVHFAKRSDMLRVLEVCSRLNQALCISRLTACLPSNLP